MRSPIERILKETLRKAQTEIVFASLFGSYRRGDYDAFSDIDVFVVYDDEDEKPIISHRLKCLEYTLNRKVHMNLFNLREFETRLKFHDYLTASIIEDSSFILGRKDIFDEAKQNLLEERPYEESIRFNRKMGFKTIRHICSYLSDLSLSSSRHYKSLLDRVIKGLNDYRLALGYIYAGTQMRSSDRGISSISLAKTGIGSTLKEIAYIEKVLKRRSKINYLVLRKLADDIKVKSAKILSLNQDSTGRMISFINSYHVEPLLRLSKAD